MNDSLSIRTMRPEEIARAVEWAAKEGWNPGYADAECFVRADRQGFFIGEVKGTPAAIISNVNYDEKFAFLGFYIVRPEWRGRGYGLTMWQAALAYAGTRAIGLDGVPAQQDNYRKSGFLLTHRNIRYGGEVAARAASAAGLVALAEVPFASIETDDATVFPASRSAFLRSWIEAPGHVGRALVRDGVLAAWGVARPCRRGFKIGPLIADDRAGAETVFDALIAAAGGGEIFLDVPEPNRAAVALAEGRGLTPVFETARMYTGPVRPIRLDRIFGITTFELG